MKRDYVGGIKLEVHLIDPVKGFPRETANQLRVLSVIDPDDPRKLITNVMCRYCLAGGEVSFQKNPHDSDESFEDALNWAKSFARLHEISDIYAANFSAEI